MAFAIKGKVSNQQNNPVSDILIKVFIPQQDNTEKEITVTDDNNKINPSNQDGNYLIHAQLPQLAVGAVVKIIVKGFKGDALVATKSATVNSNQADDVVVDLQMNDANTSKKFSVSGRVLNPFGEAIANKTLSAYDVDLKGARIYKTAKTIKELNDNGGFQLLGNAVSNSDGFYEIEFTGDAFADAEKGLADVVVYAVQKRALGGPVNVLEIIQGRSLMVKDDAYKDGVNITGLDIRLTDSKQRGISEYSLLMSIIGPFVATSGLQLFQLDDSDDQIKFLAEETGQEISNVRIAVRADKLRNDFIQDNLSAELFYALGKQKIELSWSVLLMKRSDELFSLIKKSFDGNPTTGNSISFQADEVINKFIEDILSKSFEYSVSSPELSSIFKTIGFSISDSSLQKNFLRALAEKKAKPETFWNNLAKQDGFTPAIIASLQLSNQLIILTSQHVPLVEELQVNRKINDASDLLVVTNEEWNTILKKTGTPSSVLGFTQDEKTANYLTGIRQSLHAAFPTKKIALMVKNRELQFDDANIRDKVSDFFTAAPSFNFRTSRVRDFNDVIKQVAGEENNNEVTEHLKKIQRIYQVSSSPETMNTLISKGYTSAKHIASMSQSTFLNREAASLGLGEAYQVYNRASFMAMRSQHTALKYNDTMSAFLGKYIAPDKALFTKDIKDLSSADWTSLFGPIQNCECNDCNSVFSPAAYLVDIMQFLDHCPASNGLKNAEKNDESVLDVLLRRRPDIGNMLLTCENTNTEIPYVDIVNEIMEYYIVHYDNLQGDKGINQAFIPNDSANFSSEALIAEPQFLLLDAYSKIYDKVYPFNLPYHQPLDVIRTYLHFLKTSRAELFEIFFKDSISNQPIPRAALDAENLQLNLREYEMLTGSDFNSNTVALLPLSKYYGDTNVITTGKGIMVNELLRVTGIHYTDLVDILSTKFINPGQDLIAVLQDLIEKTKGIQATEIYKELANNTWDVAGSNTDKILPTNILHENFNKWINATENGTTRFQKFQRTITINNLKSDCDIESMNLQSVQWLYEKDIPASGFKTDGTDPNIDEIFLWRLQRFIRLWKKTGFEIHELDLLLIAIKAIETNASCIRELSTVVKLNKLLDQPFNQLACLWSNMDTWGEDSLFKEIFLDNSGGSISQPGIFLPYSMNELLFPPDAGKSFKNNITNVLAVFNITQEEFSSIAAKNVLTGDSVITLSTLSAFYRYIFFAEALGITIEKLCILEELIGPPFGTFSSLTTGTSGTDKDIIIVAAGPAAVTGSVTNGSNNIILSVNASVIANVNFETGDLIWINGDRYMVMSNPVGLGTASISVTIDRNYSGETNATLDASAIQILQPAPHATLDFVNIVKKLQASKLDSTILDYILTGKANDTDSFYLPDEKLLGLLVLLRNNLSKFDNEQQPGNITPEALCENLMLLFGADISNQFISMLRDSADLEMITVVTDFTIPIPAALASKYTYSIQVTMKSGSFSISETIIDALGSTAVITGYSPVTGELAFSNLVLSAKAQTNGTKVLSGDILGQASAATATLNATHLKINGIMTDSEKNELSGVTSDENFQSAIEDLYQQTFINQGKQFLSISKVPDNKTLLPGTLTPKFSYIQKDGSTDWYLQCRGIMSDDEFDQLSILDAGKLLSASENIYKYPYNFLCANFGNFYADKNAKDIACWNIFGLAKVDTPFIVPVEKSTTLTEKINFFNNDFEPYLRKQLKAKALAGLIATVTGDNVPVTKLLIENYTDDLLTTVAKQGLEGKYFADKIFSDFKTTMPAGEINFAWGAGSPDVTKIPADGFSVRWMGWIKPPADDIYTFELHVTEADESAVLWINDEIIVNLNGVSSGTTGFGLISMEADKMYSIRLEYIETTGNAGVQLYWQSPALAKQVIPSGCLYSDGNDNKLLLDNIKLYHRAGMFIKALGLSVEEVQYFIANNVDFDNISFTNPVLSNILRMCDYTSLRKTIAPDALLAFFKRAAFEVAQGSLQPSDALISAIAAKAGWNKDYLVYLAGNAGIPAAANYFEFAPANLKNERGYIQLKNALALARKTNMQVNDTGLPAWSKLEDAAMSTNQNIQTFHDTAVQIKQAVKSRYKDNWPTLARQLNDKIRENQKQALISYLLSLDLFLLQAPAGKLVKDADTLFEYLLIDPQMSAYVLTSRLIQNTLAVQLFADRVTMNLEMEVKSNSSGMPAINPDEWEWMKHSSIERGLKMVPVYLENYLDPSFRDDKSFFFKEFEAELKKSDITDENVETAFRNYVSKLDEVSNLEVCGMFEDVETKTIYVFARTNHKAYKYFFRIRDKHEHWLAWEPIQLDIKAVEESEKPGVHLIPVVWNKRLFLFWPEFTKKSIARKSGFSTFQDIAGTKPDDNAPQQYWEIHLAWSEYLHGKWTSKRISKEFLSPLYFDDAEEYDINLYLIDPRHFFFTTQVGNELTITLSLRSKGILNVYGNEQLEIGCFKFSSPQIEILAINYFYNPASSIVPNIKVTFNSMEYVAGSTVLPPLGLIIFPNDQVEHPIGNFEINGSEEQHRINPGDLVNLGEPNFSLSFLSYEKSIVLMIDPWWQKIYIDLSTFGDNIFEFEIASVVLKFRYNIQLISYEIIDTSNPIVKISEYAKTNKNGDFFINDDYTEYNPNYQSFAESSNLHFDKIKTYIFRKVADFKALFSDRININDFKNDIENSFIFQDNRYKKSYYAVPVKINKLTSGIATKEKAAVFVGQNTSDKSTDARTSSKVDRNRYAVSEQAASNANLIEKSSNAARKSYDANMHDQSADDGSFMSQANKKVVAGSVSIINYYGLSFYTFFHPFSSIFIKRLNLGGVPALLAADTCEFPEDGSNYNISPYKPADNPGIDYSSPDVKANDQGSNFINAYNPDFSLVQEYDPTDSSRNYYLENVDFSEYGTYSVYNWELFYHAPFLVAHLLKKNGKFKESLKWHRYIFDETSTEKNDPDHKNSAFWKVLPFKKQVAEDFKSYLENLAVGYDIDPDNIKNLDGNKQIDLWRSDPLNPFLIARTRPIAFMKNTVMSCIETRIGLGDSLFAGPPYSRENIMAATQQYILALQLLGPSPEYIPSLGKIQPKSYKDLKQYLNDFGDALVDMENLFPNSGEVNMSGASPSALGNIRSLYFCLPPNSKLLEYWQTISDRLYKIRHGLNIEGVNVPLPLYDPPVDPELLLAAKAQGLDISSILADLDRPTPYQRFSALVNKAGEYISILISHAAAMLSAREKADAEAIARLKQQQEIDILAMISEVKSRQVLEARINLDLLHSNRETAIQKLNYYAVELLGNAAPAISDPEKIDDHLDEFSSLPADTAVSAVASQIDVSLVNTDESGVKIIQREKQELDFSALAHDRQGDVADIEQLANLLHLNPDVFFDVKPIGVGSGLKYGGSFLGAAMSAWSRSVSGHVNEYSFQASQASKMSNYIRRQQGWIHEAKMITREIVELDKRITVSKIQLQMKQSELDTHNKQRQNADDIQLFLGSKFTNQELYDWMSDKLQEVYKQSYDLAFDMAKKAEQAYRFELGIIKTNFIQYGYFNQGYAGLTAGDQLQLALKQMESAYLENNIREFELTKHISLVQLNSLALIELRETGTCQFNVPEELFDLDYPGHYFRRIKSVNISVPCIAGPFTTINCTLRLFDSSIRINSLGQLYKRDIKKNDNRFTETRTPFTAIATSSAQNDSGVFELNFHDERYLPFEGSGAVSSWQLELNGKYISADSGELIDLSQFDYGSISDIIISVRYTSREDNGEFKQKAIENLKNYITKESALRLFSTRHEFSNEWYQFKINASDTEDSTLMLDLNKNRLPYVSQKMDIMVKRIEVFAEMDSGTDDIGSFNIRLKINSAANDTTINMLQQYEHIFQGSFQLAGGGIKIDLVNPVTIKCPSKPLKNVMIVLHYSLK